MKATLRPKKLVSGIKYITVLGTKLSLYSFAGVVVSLGVLVLVFTVIAIIATVRSAIDVFVWLIPGAMLAGLSVVLLYFGRSLYVEGKEIEYVEILSARNASHLPLQETLVRGSTAPSSPNGELLRATVAAHDSPNEDLLRPHSTAK